MKKALIGLWFCSFLLIVTCISVLTAETRNMPSCDKLATLPSTDIGNVVDAQKSYAIRYPVL